MRTLVYPARFEPGDKPGVLVITFRDFSAAITQGNGEKDALWQATDCLEEAIAGRIAGGQAILKASRAARGERPIPVPASMAAKAALYLAMKEVRRMLDPRHPTKLPRIKEALDVFGKSLVVSVKGAA